jgi:hypothetical protein
VGSTEARNEIILRAASTFVNARPQEHAAGQKQIAHWHSRKLRLASGWPQRAAFVLLSPAVRAAPKRIVDLAPNLLHTGYTLAMTSAAE